VSIVGIGPSNFQHPAGTEFCDIPEKTPIERLHKRREKTENYANSKNVRVLPLTPSRRRVAGSNPAAPTIRK
jgi:hypothetical protein